MHVGTFSNFILYSRTAIYNKTLVSNNCFSKLKVIVTLNTSRILYLPGTCTIITLISVSPFYKSKWWNTCTHNLLHGRAVSLLHWKIILSQWTRWQCMCTVISILFKRTSIVKRNLFWFWNEARILKMETTKTPHIIDLHWLQLCWAS